MERTSIRTVSKIGELWAGFCICKFKKLTSGFENFKRLRTHLSESLSDLLLQGFIDKLKSTTISFIHDISKSVYDFNDMTLSSDQFYKHEQIFGLVATLRLVITFLNVNDTSNYAVISPVQACIIFCVFFEAVCQYLKYHPPKLQSMDVSESVTNNDSNTEPPVNDFLYDLFGTFYQGIPYFNSLIIDENANDLCATWKRACSVTETNTSDHSLSLLEILNGCDDLLPSLSFLIKRCLSLLRHLLIEQCLSNKSVRILVLETLLHVSEMVALQNSTDYQICEVMEDDKLDDYEKFLRESGQL